ncbi:hypothetical protein K466DRAFT_665177 [Polyporus arcularius HHB13444]|uniref:Uncharacterized protein n=1 Tax=Polyporus arcularius HHB13444 TaxID=1314778 RepID=A0A5C3P425_9APHY|nr:hypothetical protein K466DRAFT_665177 [Polyporus arcularius HHB13444]
MPCQLGQDPHDRYYDTQNFRVVSHVLVLEDDERGLNVPEDLKYRADSRTYTWRIVFANHTPEFNPYCGRIGDVWVNTAVGEENIWIKAEGPSWNLWHKKVNYGTKKWNDSALKFRHSYHPWLPERLLQFSGPTLGWFPRRQYRAHRSSWDQDIATRGCLNLPTYDELDVPWIARHISSRVLPEAPPNGDVHNRNPPASSALVGCLPSESPDIAVTVKSDLQSFSQNQDKKRRSDDPVLDPRKRPRPQDEKPSSLVRDPPPHIEPRSPAPSPSPSPSPSPPAVFDLEQYLTALPLSLSQHAHIFAALGFSENAYFDSLALMPKRFCDEAIAILRERGLTFMETLVFRNALNSIRRSAPARQTATRPQLESVRTFLAWLCPPLERRAPIFEDLGIDATHIPVLAQLDRDSYTEFEDTLKEKGATWVEVFMINAGIRSLCDERQEPLLLAV